jgi:hypothetical protein
VLLLATSQRADAAWFDTDWAARQPITVSSTLADANLTNYPLLVRIVDPANELFTDAQADGDDILFTASDGTTKLPHEIEFYDAGTNTLYAWVQVPLISSTVDTTVYMYYDNGTVGNQQNVTGTWDNDYVMVQHLQETSGTHLDSTSLNNDGTPQNGVTQNAAGRIDGADQFDGSDDYVSIPDDTSLRVVEMTVEAWVYVPSSIPSSYHGIVVHGPSTNNWYGLWNNGNRFHYRWSSGAVRRTDFSATFSPDQWYYVAGVLDVPNDQVLTYQNEATDTVVPGPDLPTPTSGPTYIGTTFSGSERFKGFIDEVRVSKVARSPEWIKASYRSQNDPDSYLSLGAEQEYSECPGGIVSTTTDSTTGGSLRACVIWANGNPGADTITVPAGTYTLTLGASGEGGALEGDLDILENLTINGAGARTTIIDGNGNDRIFDLLANAADLALSDITLRNGDPQGGDGGAILNTDNTVTLTDVRLTGNTADKGGAIYVSSGDAQLDVNRALFDNNTASEGGGIFGTDPGTRLNITNATITGNTGTSKGGAIWADHVALVNSTIVGNTSPDAAGVYKDSSQTFAAINSIIANNTGTDCNVTFNSGNNNIDSDGTCGFATTADPMLLALGDFGGSTDTMYPQSGSPAVDGGTNIFCPALDQRSESRPQGALCDVGAVEAASGGICPGGLVTTTTDSTTGGSLRACIIWANTNPGADTITVPAGTYALDLVGAGENSAATGDLDILEDVTITGAGARTTIIDGNSTDRIFETFNDSIFNLSNVTLQNGDAQGNNGGAIDNRNGPVTLTDVTVFNNTAKDGGGLGSSGGGVTYNLNRVTLTGNTAEKGAGIRNDSGGDFTSMTNVTITGNTASTEAGGMLLDDATLLNITVVGNTAPASKWGGLRNGGTWSMTNSIVANNTGDDCNESPGSGTNNIDFDGTCGVATTADPKLSALADNGGQTDTMMPQSDSPAIEGGTNTGCPADDQRSVARPDGALCDVGAVEVVLNQLTGKVFEDADFAGAATDYDGGTNDLALANVDVELYTSADGYIGSTTTDASGNFSFWVADGSYKVRARSATIGDSNTARRRSATVTRYPTAPSMPPAVSPTRPAAWPARLPSRPGPTVRRRLAASPRRPTTRRPTTTPVPATTG